MGGGLLGLYFDKETIKFLAHPSSHMAIERDLQVRRRRFVTR